MLMHFYPILFDFFSFVKKSSVDRLLFSFSTHTLNPCFLVLFHKSHMFFSILSFPYLEKEPKIGILHFSQKKKNPPLIQPPSCVLYSHAELVRPPEINFLLIRTEIAECINNPRIPAIYLRILQVFLSVCHI